MSSTEVLDMNVAALDRMSRTERERVEYVCRNIRGTINGLVHHSSIAGWERSTGMTVENAKSHTLALLDRIEELK